MANSGRVILVDGSSLLFRAYFALPGNLATSSGLHTNAIYGFALMFRKMFAGKTPELGVVVFDAPGRTFRDDLYAEYKAQRPRMPSDLREQLAWIDRLVAAHNFPIVRVPGVEADDVIGTLTRLALEAGKEVHIVAADKDFAQLIGPDVRMIDTIRDITYDPELVRKKWGVPPEQFIDYLALVGDKIDNVPGVAGIGAKGAAGLLEKYGTVEGILDNLEALTPRQQKVFAEHRDIALLSKKLVTIDQHVALDRGLEDLRVVPPETGALNELYRELQFYSLLSADALSDLSASGDDVSYAPLASADKARALVAGATAPVAVLPVHEQPTPMLGDLVGIALATAPGSARYLAVAAPTGALGSAGLEALRGWFEDPERPKVVHDAKQLYVALKRHGITLRGVTADPQLESYLVDPTGLIPHRIDQLVKEYLHRTVRAAKTVVGSGKKEKRYAECDLGEVSDWACHLVDAVMEMWPKIRARLEAEGHLDQLLTHDLPLSWILGDMEVVGIRVDKDDLVRMGVEFRAKLADIEATIHTMAGRPFNIASPKQLGEVLFDELGLPVIKRTKTGYSTNAEVLERLASQHEVVKQILEWRKLAKLINTYTDVLTAAVHPETGRVHATFRQTTAATGRLITTDPDLQRTPVRTAEGKRIRQTFIADPGRKLISADWSQIELRLLAHFSRDPGLVEAFTKEIDVHKRTATEIFGCTMDEVTAEQRAAAKTVNFATIYGQGATALGQNLGIKRNEAKRYIESYFEAYAGVRNWLDDTIADGMANGYVETLLGRRRYIPELSSNNTMLREAGKRIAANTPIQGSAADICKLVMLDLPRRFEAAKLDVIMMLQVHDELVFSVAEGDVEAASAIVRDAMEHVWELEVPLIVDVGVGDSWGEAH